MTRIKKFVKPLCFILLFCLILHGFSRLVLPHNMYYTGVRGFYLEEKDSLDMIYIGSSGACMSWMPYEAYKDHGFTSYDFGNSLLPSFSYCAMLREALKYQKPELVLIEARPLHFTYNGLDEGKAFEPFHTMRLTSALPLFSPNRLAIIAENYRVYKNSIDRETQISKQENFLSFLFDIVRYHSNLFLLTPDSIWDNVFNLPANYSRGYCYSDLYTHVIHEIPHEDCSGVTEEVPINDRALKDLDDLLSELDKEGLKAVFTISPCYETRDQKAMFNFIERYVKERGYDFVDTNDYFDEMGLSEKTDFCDLTHMNYWGAKKCTDFLGKYIAENYSFSKQHSAELISEWDEGYERWSGLAETWKQTLDQVLAVGHIEKAGEGNELY